MSNNSHNQYAKSLAPKNFGGNPPNGSASTATPSNNSGNTKNENASDFSADFSAVSQYLNSLLQVVTSPEDRTCVLNCLADFFNRSNLNKETLEFFTHRLSRIASSYGHQPEHSFVQTFYNYMTKGENDGDSRAAIYVKNSDGEYKLDVFLSPNSYNKGMEYLTKFINNFGSAQLDMLLTDSSNLTNHAEIRDNSLLVYSGFSTILCIDDWNAFQRNQATYNPGLACHVEDQLPNYSGLLKRNMSTYCSALQAEQRSRDNATKELSERFTNQIRLLCLGTSITLVYRANDGISLLSSEELEK